MKCSEVTRKNATKFIWFVVIYDFLRGNYRVMNRILYLQNINILSYNTLNSFLYYYKEKSVL